MIQTLPLATPLIGKGPPEFPSHLVEREFFRPLSGDNNDILMIGDLTAVATKIFSKKPLDSVTDDRIPHLRADRHAESVFSLVVCLADDNKMGGVNLSLPS